MVEGGEQIWQRQTYTFLREIRGIGISARVSFAHRYHSSLIIVLFQMDHILYAPIYTQRTLQYDTPVHFTAAYLMALIIEIFVILLHFGIDVVARKWYLIVVGDARRRALSTKTFMWFDAATMAKQLRAEQGTVAWHMTIRYTFVLGMLANGQTFAAFFAAQTFRMPIVA